MRAYADETVVSLKIRHNNVLRYCRRVTAQHATN